MKQDLEKDWGDTQRTMRAARKLSQADLSRITGISQSQISRLENGLHPRPHEKAAILRAFTEVRG